MSDVRRTVILGAAGRDFHNFNVLYRDDATREVVAFTATQIPDIAGRRYPAELAGERYPGGIPIVDEADLEDLIARENVDECVFSYSDIAHADVMHLASRCIAAGADFVLPGGAPSMIASTKPVISVCAVRTGVGKSQTSRYLVRILQELGKKVVSVRHPMPYGDLAKQAVQRFASYADLDAHECTIEEREEYEPHIDAGFVIYAGVDYEAILRRAEQEADVIVWDGGNNDFPFVRPDLVITVVDPLRPGHESTYHPGETTLRLADVVVVNKVDSADPADVERVVEAVGAMVPAAIVIRAESPVTLDGSGSLAGKRVLVVEDGPTLTHGGMPFGAGTVAARAAGAAEIVDPRPYAVGLIAETYRIYPDTGAVLPAMGYSDEQLSDLAATMQAAPVDVVVSGTPMDLGRLIDPGHPMVTATYALREVGSPTLADVLAPHLEAWRA